MTTPPSLDTARILPRHRDPAARVDELIRLEAAKEHRAHINRTTPDTPTFEVPRHDDPARLRGIPAIGRNVTGAIPGTIPHQLA